MAIRDVLIRSRNEESKKKWVWMTRDEMLKRFNGNVALVDDIEHIKRRNGQARENLDIQRVKAAVQFKILAEQSETETDIKQWQQEMAWEAELTGEDAGQFSKDASKFMESEGEMLGSASSAIGESPHSREEATEPEDPPLKKPQKGKGKGKGADTPENTKEQKEEELKKRKRDKEADIPEKIQFSSVRSHDVAEEVDVFLAKLLSTAQDAAMLAAEFSILDEQVALRDKLTQSEQAMKTVYHKIIAQRSSLSTHKVDSYATLVGQAVTHVEAFRKIEMQAKPLTKNIGGKRKKQKKE